MGFPFPLPIQSYLFHWKTRETTRLTFIQIHRLLHKLEIGFSFLNYVQWMVVCNSDLIFCGETTENRRKSKEKRNGKLECQSQKTKEGKYVKLAV